jgi:hypothetical protein
VLHGAVHVHAEGQPGASHQSPLGAIQPDHWLAEYTTELIDLLNALGWLADLEPAQAALLEKVCAGPAISLEELRATEM